MEQQVGAATHAALLNTSAATKTNITTVRLRPLKLMQATKYLCIAWRQTGNAHSG